MCTHTFLGVKRLFIMFFKGSSDYQKNLPAVTVFSGSFLLFLLQPLTGRTLLPFFGGGASVWMVCLAVYQTLLLIGYGYAHFIAQRESSHPARFQRLHLGLLGVSIVWTMLVIALRPVLGNLFGASQEPMLEVLFCVLLVVGLPYTLLSANASLVQSWVSQNQGGGQRSEVGEEQSTSAFADKASADRVAVGSGQEQPTSHVPSPKSDVYRLYAVSNLGSFCGLLIYPFLLEPFVPLTLQWGLFILGLAGYVALLAKLARETEGSQTLSREDVGRGTWDVQHFRTLELSNFRTVTRTFLWLLLPATTSCLLNAVTAHLSIDVTPMPLIWVILLSAFLLSYVIGFSAWAHKGRLVLFVGAGLALFGAAYARGLWGTGSLIPNLSAGVGLLLFIGSLLHGWLYELRPPAEKLTRYYLFIAMGGAAGGLASALLPPLVFTQVWEYPLILAFCAGLIAWRFFTRYRLLLACCSIVVWVIFAQATQRKNDTRVLARSRNFYGCLWVTQVVSREATRQIPVHYLWCGQTTHGKQIRTPEGYRQPTTYFGPTGGGIAFGAHPRYQQGLPITCGVVGLGAGTLATYGRKGDLFRFYEINQQMIDIATNSSLFTFLPTSPAAIDLILGDARRMLERERDNHQQNPKRDPRYDLLIIDAYNGDAVPYHLTTREAFQLYFDRLKPEGMLAVHISNWHIDLLPACKAVAADLKVFAYGAFGYPDSALTTTSIWVFMTRQPLSYRYPGRPDKIKDIKWSEVKDIRTLTDERGSLMTLLR
jgi:hypothetical protein